MNELLSCIFAIYCIVMYVITMFMYIDYTTSSETKYNSITGFITNRFKEKSLFGILLESIIFLPWNIQWVMFDRISYIALHIFTKKPKSN